jgi:hypothetical protein
MQIQVDAHSDEVVEQAGQLLSFYLANLEGEVDRIDIAIESSTDRVGMPLHRCRVRIRTGYGWRSEVEEIQSDLLPAITRALDRSVRTMRRRLKLRRHTRCA